MDTNDRSTDANTNPTNRSSLSHTLDIIKAAFPYLDSQSQQTLNVFIKTGELFETFHSIQPGNLVTSLSVRKQSIDIEALLNGIRDVCNKREKDLIDMILNFYMVKNLYSTYATLASTMASESDGTGNASDLGSMFGMDGSTNMMDLLGSFLTPEQKSTFENLNMMFSATQ